MSEEQEPTPPPTPSEVPPPAPQDETPPPAPVGSPASPPQGGTAPVPGADKKMLAGLLAIFLGAFGVHKFILGYQKEGITMAVIGGVGLVGSFIPLVGCITGFGIMATSIIGLIEGIIYLTKSDEEFVNTYITNQKPWF
jgi:TM2 domain-containing membrane protein YozV